MMPRVENQNLFKSSGRAVFAAAVASFALAACGAKSDPVADYSDLRAGAVPPYKQTKTQQVAAVDRFKLAVYGAGDAEINGALTFEIGKPTAYKVVGGIYEAGVASVLKVAGLPPGTAMVADLEHPGQYLISGTPRSQGCAAAGKPRVISFSWEIIDPDKVNQNLLNSIMLQTSRSKEYALSGGLSGGAIGIKGVTGLESGVDEGRAKSFSVVVTDPNSDAAHAPTLLILPDVGEGAGGRSPLSIDQMIAPNVGQGERLQDGSWKFVRALNVTSAMPGATGRFVLKAIGSCLQNQSPPLAQTVLIHRAEPAPALAANAAAQSPTKLK